jgi:hypothetical protein
VNLQYLYKYVFGLQLGETDPIARAQLVLSGQAARVQHGASARLAGKWLHETFEADVSAAGYFGPRGIVIRPKLSYAVSDHVGVIAGVELYRGEDASLFGLLRSNSATFVETRFTF